MAAAPGLNVFAFITKYLPKPDMDIKNVRTITECDNCGNIKKHRVKVNYSQNSENFESSFIINR